MSRRPLVFAHVAVSVEGASTGFQPDLGRFYELARTWQEGVDSGGALTGALLDGDLLDEISLLIPPAAPRLPGLRDPSLVVPGPRETLARNASAATAPAWQDVPVDLDSGAGLLHRLTSYAPDRDWDVPADDPRVRHDLARTT